MEHSNKFQPGKVRTLQNPISINAILLIIIQVFKIIWYEHRGSSIGKNTEITEAETKTVLDQYREEYFVGFRRFIIVANDAGHCTCM